MVMKVPSVFSRQFSRNCTGSRVEKIAILILHIK
jgi:hypothetical protein